jgi:hypothetical protein
MRAVDDAHIIRVLKAVLESVIRFRSAKTGKFGGPALRLPQCVPIQRRKSEDRPEGQPRLRSEIVRLLLHRGRRRRIPAIVAEPELVHDRRCEHVRIAEYRIPRIEQLHGRAVNESPLAGGIDLPGGIGAEPLSCIAE